MSSQFFILYLNLKYFYVYFILALPETVGNFLEEYEEIVNPTEVVLLLFNENQL